MAPAWNDPETVAFFRDRAPDHRLVALCERGEVRRGARVLDLGCAGGRNTAYLTDRGIHVDALDTAPAMIAATRDRLAATLGPTAARARVRLGSVEALDDYADAGYDLVLALGVLQHTGDEGAFEAALAHLARVTRSGGSALVAHFSPASRKPLARIPGTNHTYVGFDDNDPATRLVMHDAQGLDAAFAPHGFTPLQATETVFAAEGTRVTINAHYRLSKR
jgi:SAM-dependent methyltransferase